MDDVALVLTPEAGAQSLRRIASESRIRLAMRTFRHALVATLAILFLSGLSGPWSESLNATERAGRGLRSRKPGARRDDGLTRFAQPPAMRPGDEVWFLSTHTMSRYSTQPEAFQVNQFVDGVSNPSSVDQLLGHINADIERLNVVFVHGNRTNLYWATQRGWLFYQQVVSQCPDDQPVRLVVWAWPSQQQSGPVRDFREKAQLADQEGNHFAWFLRRVEPTRPLSLVGYSFGARVVMGGVNRVAHEGFFPDRPFADLKPAQALLQHLDQARQQAIHAPTKIYHQIHDNLRLEPPAIVFGSLHETNSASLAEPSTEMEDRSVQFATSTRAEQVPTESGTQDLDDQLVERPAYRVALVAAAFDREWIMSGGKLSAAYDTIDELLLINNSSDQAMKYFGFIPRGYFPTALGKEGPGCLQRLSDWGAKIAQVDVANVVGSEHKIDLYFHAPSVVNRLHNILFHTEQRAE